MAPPGLFMAFKIVDTNKGAVPGKLYGYGPSDSTACSSDESILSVQHFMVSQSLAELYHRFHRLLRPLYSLLRLQAAHAMARDAKAKGFFKFDG